MTPFLSLNKQVLVIILRYYYETLHHKHSAQT